MAMKAEIIPTTAAKKINLMVSFVREAPLIKFLIIGYYWIIFESLKIKVLYDKSKHKAILPLAMVKANKQI